MRGVQVHGDVIRSLRITRGFTQDQLAQAADLDVTTLRKMEKGGKAFDLKTVTALALALDCHLMRIIIPDTPTVDGNRPERDYLDCLARYRDGFLQKDVEHVLACYTDDAVISFPSLIPTVASGLFEGHAAIRQHLELTFQTFTPHIPTLEESEVYVFEDRVMLRHVGSAVVRHNGAVFRSECLFEFWFRDGKICKHVGLFDTAAMAAALNAPPKTP